MTTQIDQLNRRFGADGTITFKELAPGFPALELDNGQARATIALQGAQVMTWAPRGQQPVIWLSRAAKFAPGKSIRGGVPVCWPWFGVHATEPSFPAHGFARTVPWELLDAQTRDGETRLRLRIAPGAAPPAQRPSGAEATIEITVGAALGLSLITRNNGAQPLALTEALHTYFEVGDVRSVAVHGLDGLAYLDKVEGLARKRQAGAVTVSGEVDRIYLDSVADCIIDDPISNRRIRIAKRGSRSTVVWNPWIEKAAKMGDLGEDGYLHMICVESGNAAENVVQIAPGAEHRMTVRYTVEPL